MKGKGNEGPEAKDYPPSLLGSSSGSGSRRVAKGPLRRYPERKPGENLSSWNCVFVMVIDWRL